MIDYTHDASLRSWVESANEPGTDFPIQNLPFVTFRLPGQKTTALGVGIGDQVLNATQAFGIESMMSVMSMPRSERADLRRRMSDYLAVYSAGAENFLTPMESVEFLLPCEIRDYTDFYASIHHATNVGRMFRPDNPLLPNYKHVPIAYHGRSSSLVVSGTPVRRPHCQLGEGRFGPTGELDYEVEVAAFLGPG